MQIHALSACIANLGSHEVGILLIAPLLNHPEAVPRPVQNVVVRLCRCHMDTELCGRMDEIHRFNPATLWFNLHGQSLTAGERTYKKLCLIIEALGDPPATTFNSKDFAHYRDKRLSGEIYFSDKWKNGRGTRHC